MLFNKYGVLVNQNKYSDKLTRLECAMEAAVDDCIAEALSRGANNLELRGLCDHLMGVVSVAFSGARLKQGAEMRRAERKVNLVYHFRCPECDNRWKSNEEHGKKYHTCSACGTLNILYYSVEKLSIKGK